MSDVTSSQDVLRRALEGVRLNEYIIHDPTLKQRLFLMMPHREVLFGGAAGGGKSDALLMAALQYCDVPGYNAILFRKTFSDLDLPSSLIPRSQEWLMRSGSAEWNAQKREWRFDSGAKLVFGYMNDATQKFRYQSTEFHFIGFDELTQFPEEDYLYLHSRLRKRATSELPLRIRSATNPGGVGHLWVKKRFDIGPREIAGKTKYVGNNQERLFLPSLISDNPHLDQSEYEESLKNLDPVTREQLLNGDWGVSADGRFRSGWARYFSTRGQNWYVLGPGGHGEVVAAERMELFMIVDPAASTKEGPTSERIYRKGPSATVIGLFGRTIDHNHLLWIDADIGRWELPEVFDRIGRMFKRWRPETMGIEASGLGIGVVELCERAGYPVRRVSPRSQDKLVRATDATTRMQNGKIWFPETAWWLPDVQAELFTWTGDPMEPDDVVDVLSYAALYVSEVARDEADVIGAEMVKSVKCMPFSTNTRETSNYTVGSMWGI